MLFRIAFAFPLLVSFSSILATPVTDSVALARRDDFSLNNWGGFKSLNGFDDFFGVDNFDGSKNEQVLIQKQERLVCDAREIRLVQQRLVVLQELAKKIILERVCEVETQVIVLEQFRSGIHNFRFDLDRRSGRRTGYDRDIVSHHNRIIRDDGKISDDDFGFKGREVGSHSVVVEGSNWDDGKSRDSVRGAWEAARKSKGGTSKYKDLH